MKIGLSYSRCVRDIVDGKVDIGDVLVIIARTDFDPRDDAQWGNIWTGYGGGSHLGSVWTAPEWSGYQDEDLFRNVSIELWKSGKLHQPRQFGVNPGRMHYYWLECIVPEDDITNPAVKEAFDYYKLLAGLTVKS